MLFYLGKLSLLLVYPPGLTIILLLAAALVRRRKPWLAGTLTFTAILTLCVLGSPMTGNALLGRLESQFPQIAPEAAPKADAIVVLGGYLHVPGGQRRAVEMDDAVDRLWMGRLLYVAGKAQWVLVTGGNVAILGGGKEPEAVVAKELLHQWGVPYEAILVEGESRNTHENATFSKPILAAKGLRKLLLVTSAFHMPRSIAIFRHEGLDVSPVPTDYQVGWSPADALFEWCPSAEALSRNKIAVKEWMGLAMYRLRGWA